MKKLTIPLLFVLLIALCIVGFKLLFGKSSVEVNDVTKEAVITLTEIHRPKSVHSIDITITGHIAGFATIQRSYQDKIMYEPKLISGNVNLHLGGDWYSDKCLIIYKPSNVTSGNLKINYKFDTL